MLLVCITADVHFCRLLNTSTISFPIIAIAFLCYIRQKYHLYLSYQLACLVACNFLYLKVFSFCLPVCLYVSVFLYVCLSVCVYVCLSHQFHVLCQQISPPISSIFGSVQFLLLKNNDKQNKGHGQETRERTKRKQ